MSHDGSGRRGIEPRRCILLGRHQRQHTNNSDVCGVAALRRLVKFDSEAITPWTTGRSLIEEHEVVFVEPLSASRLVRLSLGCVTQFLTRIYKFEPEFGAAQCHLHEVMRVLHVEEDLRRASGISCIYNVVEGVRSQQSA